MQQRCLSKNFRISYKQFFMPPLLFTLSQNSYIAHNTAYLAIDIGHRVTEAITHTQHLKCEFTSILESFCHNKMNHTYH